LPKETETMSGSSKRKKKSQIILDQKRCKGCALCILFCPKEVLAQNEAGKIYVQNQDACTLCLNCEIYCPDFAITVKELEEEQ